jgi:hypothetical protein
MATQKAARVTAMMLSLLSVSWSFSKSINRVNHHIRATLNPVFSMVPSQPRCTAVSFMLDLMTGKLQERRIF